MGLGTGGHHSSAGGRCDAQTNFTFCDNSSVGVLQNAVSTETVSAVDHEECVARVEQVREEAIGLEPKFELPDHHYLNRMDGRQMVQWVKTHVKLDAEA